MHEGHLAVARGVLDAGLAEEVWMLPCRQNPLKGHAPEYSDAERLALIEEAVGRLEKEGKAREGAIKVCDIELGMPAPSYTSATLRELARRHPDHEFRIVVGADSYLGFGKWKDSEWIERNFAPIVYPRPGYEISEARPGWTLLRDVPQIDISSTQIRLWKRDQR